MGDQLLPYLPQIMPAVIESLAGETELIRDTAFKASQAIVQRFAYSALDPLLDVLHNALLDNNWRIRQSSVLILGHILYIVSNAGARDESNRKGLFICTHTHTHTHTHTFIPPYLSFSLSLSPLLVNRRREQLLLIVRVLTVEMWGGGIIWFWVATDLSLLFADRKRSDILSILYMLRSDVHSVVCQQAAQVWKSVVSHTPKTLRQIITCLMNDIIACLSSSNTEKRQMASKTLGDVVRKLGERILPDIVPILAHGLESADSNTRQGVCLSLTEVISSAGRQNLTQFLDQLIPIIRRALCDPYVVHNKLTSHDDNNTFTSLSRIQSLPHKFINSLYIYSDYTLLFIIYYDIMTLLLLYYILCFHFLFLTFVCSNAFETHTHTERERDV
jgi:hypothetical protein